MEQVDSQSEGKRRCERQHIRADSRLQPTKPRSQVNMHSVDTFFKWQHENKISSEYVILRRDDGHKLDTF
jgi:hypothetical protein